MSKNEKQMRSLSGMLAARSVMIYVVVGFLAILSIVPFWYMFMASTWDTFEIQSGIKMYPGSISQLVKNWNGLNDRSSFSMPLGFANSFIITTSATALTVYFSALTAYGIKVYDFRGKKIAFGFIVGVMMVPTAVNITGFYRLMHTMNLLGTKWPLIIPAIAAPSTVFFIKQYLDSSLSMEIIEASRIDGANEFFTFNRICLPIMVPALATQAIFAYISNWNNYFAPAIILTKSEDKTLPLMVAELYGDRFADYGQIFTGLSASVIPLIIIYSFLQRFIIQGVSAGSVKE